MKTQAKLVEKWSYLRGLLIQQIDSVEMGDLQMHSNDVNVSVAAVARLKAEIAEFDALIGAARKKTS